jgi:dUTP pyrophosphatase
MLFVPILRPTLRIVDHFSVETARGPGGFGSTGTGHRPDASSN